MDRGRKLSANVRRRKNNHDRINVEKIIIVDRKDIYGLFINAISSFGFHFLSHVEKLVRRSPFEMLFLSMIYFSELSFFEHRLFEHPFFEIFSFEFVFIRDFVFRHFFFRRFSCRYDRFRLLVSNSQKECQYSIRIRS